MKFLKQIKFEILNILRSRFLFIIGILVIAASIVLPIAGLFVKINPNNWGPRPLYKEAYAVGIGGDGNQQSITVDGITITSDNPFFWNIQQEEQDKIMLSGKDPGMGKIQFQNPETYDVVLSMVDTEQKYFLKYAQIVTKQSDYRLNLVYMTSENLYDKFIYENSDKSEEVLTEAYNYRRGMDPQAFHKKFFEITATERLAAIDKADEALATAEAIIANNDFPKFIDLSVKQQNDQIAMIQASIDLMTKQIQENPDLEESLGIQIDQMQKQIDTINTSTIPMLRFRLERHIVPEPNTPREQMTWQNQAIDDVEGGRNQLVWTVIMPEEQFNKDMNMVQQYKTYQRYKDSMQAQIDQINSSILVAQKSLDADKPDMKYVPGGSRSKTVQFLDFSAIVALFGVLLGGWIIASEFQQGTIRLLMIRPKGRLKVLVSKFIAAFAVTLAVYLVCGILSFVTNGFVSGFSDYAFPNYAASGAVGFLAYFAPKFLVCIITILFGFSVAFMLSVLSKNAAVSIIVPVVLFFCCYLSTYFSDKSYTVRAMLQWLAYTPVPYVQLAAFFTPVSPVQMAIQSGIKFFVPMGIAMIAVLTVICMAVSMIVFKKRDITN